MKSGEILLLNNWTSLHRRTAFDDSLDPERKRHLLRVWLSMPNSRPHLILPSLKILVPMKPVRSVEA